MKSWRHTELAHGLVFGFHTLERGASAPRRPKDGPPTIVVLHYTACPGLPRRSIDYTVADRIHKAERKGMVSATEAIGAIDVGDCFQRSPPPGETLMLPDVFSQVAIAAASPREACAHFYVASLDLELNDRGVDSLPIEAREPRPVKAVAVAEFVDPNRIAHHIGPLDGWTNRRSIGIEVCYPGPAPRTSCKDEEHARAWYSARGWTVPDPWSPVVCLDGLSRWVAPLPPRVVDVVVGLVADLCTEYHTISHVCSHWTFAPTKRIDPDPPLSVHEVALRAGCLCGRPLATSKPKR